MSEKVKIKIARNVVHLPAIALRGLVVFPNNVVHFEVGRTKSIAAIEAAMHNNSSVFLVAQREMDVEEPALRDLYGYGVIAEIKQVLRVSEDIVKVLVEGKTRARLLELDSADKYLQATVRPVPVRGIAADKRTQVEALVRSLKDCFEEYLSYSPQISKDVVYNIISSDSPLYLSEYMPANLLLKYEDKQVILNESTLLGRLEKLLTLLRSFRTRSMPRWTRASGNTTCVSRCTLSARSWAIPRIPAPRPIHTVRRSGRWRWMRNPLRSCSRSVTVWPVCRGAAPRAA